MIIADSGITTSSMEGQISTTSDSSLLIQRWLMMINRHKKNIKMLVKHQARIFIHKLLWSTLWVLFEPSFRVILKPFRCIFYHQMYI